MKLPVWVWFLAPTLIIVTAGLWFFSSNQTPPKSEEKVLPAAVSKAVEGTQDFEIISREHIPAGTSGHSYNSDPPTSGPHWPEPAKIGTYDKPLPDEQLIHNLEHGHIWISYKPDLAEDLRKQLDQIVKKDSWKIIMTPREKDDAQIVLAAWGRLLKMNDLDKTKVEDFIKTYRNRGPEKVMDD